MLLICVAIAYSLMLSPCGVPTAALAARPGVARTVMAWRGVGTACRAGGEVMGDTPLIDIYITYMYIYTYIFVACEKLDNLLTKYIFDLAKDFLAVNRQTFFELREGLPSASWHRGIVQISLTIASLALPRSSIYSRCTVSTLQSKFLNPLFEDLCSQLKTKFSGREYEAYFRYAA